MADRTRVLYVEDRESFAHMIIEAMQERGLDPVWCQTFDGAVRAESHTGASVCVADYDLSDPDGRTGLDFLETFDGRRILFSGNAPRVPDGVEYVSKASVLDLLDLLVLPASESNDA